MQWGHPETVIGGCLLMAAIVMVWRSVWLKGRVWFIATVSLLGLALLALEWNIKLSTSALQVLLEVGGIALGYAVIFYLVAGRYLTMTPITDVTFQSHDSLVKFIDDSGDTSLLSKIMRRAGPWLLVAVLAYGLVVAWAKFTGAVD